MKTLVIGFGNPLRGDDGLGWHAAQHLHAILPVGTAEVRACHQLAPELALELSEVDMSIFIDASAVGTPGEFTCQRVTTSATSPAGLTHDFDIPSLLALAEGLYGHAPQAHVLTITGATFAYSERLSAEVERVLPDLVEHARALIMEAAPHSHRRLYHA